MGVETAFNPALKLLRHPEQVMAFMRGDYRQPPTSVEIAPTNHCTARCPWCFYIASSYRKHHTQEELGLDLLCAALRDMGDMGVRSVVWTGGGDPSLYSGINEVSDLASLLGLQQGIFTNAYKPLDCPERFAWIRITVTEQFRITKHVARYAAATKCGVNFNLTQENEKHLKSMVKAARTAGCAYFQVRPALADRWETQQPVAVPEWLREYETSEFRVILTPYKFEDHARPHGYPICHGHRVVPFLWYNGDLSVCAYHFGRQEFVFGNLRELRFRDIWLGDRRRGMLDSGVAVIPECQHCCRLHEFNKSFASLRREGPEPEDLDFV